MEVKRINQKKLKQASDLIKARDPNISKILAGCNSTKGGLTEKQMCITTDIAEDILFVYDTALNLLKDKEEEKGLTNKEYDLVNKIEEERNTLSLVCINLNARTKKKE